MLDFLSTCTYGYKCVSEPVWMMIKMKGHSLESEMLRKQDSSVANKIVCICTSTDSGIELV